MSNETLKTTLDVKVGKDTYIFRIPTLHQEIAIGSRMEALHKEIDPSWDGYSQGLDWGTLRALRACAIFETLLDKASVTWPFTEAPDKKITVDSSKFPPEKAAEAIVVLGAYDIALAEFRSPRTTDITTTGTETVDGKPDSGQS